MKKKKIYTEEQKIKRRAYNRAWFAAHPGYTQNMSEERRARRLARQRAYQLDWSRAHPGYHAEYRQRNLDKARKTNREQSRSYRLRFPERVKAWNKADRERRREAVRESKRCYYNANKDRIKGIVAQWRKDNPERKRELHRAYKKRNPDKVTEHALRRRSRLLSGTVEDCTAKIQLLKRTSCFCHWCCAPLIRKSGTRTTRTLEIDHVVPVSRGGKHCPDNLVAACRSCNASKNDNLVHEWKWQEAA